MSGVGWREGGNGRGRVLSSTESILSTRSGDSFGCVVCALCGWMGELQTRDSVKGLALHQDFFSQIFTSTKFFCLFWFCCCF